MKEYDVDCGSFIGGWYMPEEVCDSVVSVLNSEQDKLVEGECGYNGVKPEVKKCKELYISPNEFEKISKYLENLTICLNLYRKKYPFCDEVGEYSLRGNNIKIQHYMPGDGFYKWHMENCGFSDTLYRHLAFMTYLNTLDDAGTEFYHQKTTTPCEKGLTIIWPAGWTHTHRGVTNYEGEKTIITGWLSFHVE